MAHALAPPHRPASRNQPNSSIGQANLSLAATANSIELVQNTGFNLIELMRQQKAHQRAAYLQEKALQQQQ